MPEGTIAQMTREALVLVLMMSLPALLLAAVVGLIVGLLQAVTQIQDQTLPLAVKVICVLLLLVLLGPMLSGPLVREAEQVFLNAGRIGSSVVGGAPASAP